MYYTPQQHVIRTQPLFPKTKIAPSTHQADHLRIDHIDHVHLTVFRDEMLREGSVIHIPPTKNTHTCGKQELCHTDRTRHTRAQELWQTFTTPRTCAQELPRTINTICFVQTIQSMPRKTNKINALQIKQARDLSPPEGLDRGYLIYPSCATFGS